MADRQLPELQTRLRLDAKDLDRAERRLNGFIAKVRQADTSGLQRQLSGVSKRTDEFARDATRNLTLPLAAAGLAAGKLSYDFNQSFNVMQSLAGVTAGEIDSLKQSVLDLSGDTARSPQELAQALYFIRSAGLEGQTALDALKASAEGAAIGLGSTQSVADAVTSAVNAYGSENLSAAKAVDVLAAAVEQGKGEAADFAPQLGQLLPLATNLGVGFDEVAGSLAFLTQTGYPAAQAATAINGIFQKLIRPTAQAKQELDKVGLSVDDLRKMVAEQGLLPALQLLNEKLGGDPQKFGRIFEDAEGLAGALALLRDNGAPAAKVLDQVANSGGKVEEKFAALSKTDQFKFQKTLVDLQKVGIQVGEDLLPVLADMADVISGMTDAFGRLPGPVQKGLLTMVALAAVVGPVSKVVSLTTGAVSGLLKAASSPALDSFRLGLQGLVEPGAGAANSVGGLLNTVATTPAILGTAGGLLAGFVIVLADMADQAKATAEDVKSLVGELEQGTSIEDAVSEKLARTLAGFGGGDGGFAGVRDSARLLKKALEEAGVGSEELRKALLGTDKQWEQFKQNFARNLAANGFSSGVIGPALSDLQSMRSSTEDTKQKFADLRDEESKLGVETDNTGASAAATAGSIDAMAGAASTASDEFVKAAQDARSLFEAHRQVDDSAQAVVTAQQELADAQRAARGDSEEYARAQAAIVDAEKAVRDAQKESKDAQRDLTQARIDAKEKLQDLQFASEEAALAEVSAQESLAAAKKDSLKARTADERAAADLRIKQADLALREAKDRKGDASSELAKATAKGVDGSDAVVAAQERITAARDRERDAQGRLSDATNAAAQVIADAQEKVAGATQKVIDAQLNHIDAQNQVTTATDGAVTANDELIIRLFKLAGTLDPNSTLRRRIVDYIADLQAMRDLEAAAPTPNGSLGTTTANGGAVPPGAVNAERQGGRIMRAPTKNLVGASSVAAPTGTPAPVPAPSSAPAHVEVHVNVTGQPDSATIAQLERVAGRTVEKALRRVAVGL